MKQKQFVPHDPYVYQNQEIIEINNPAQVYINPSNVIVCDEPEKPTVQPVPQAKPVVHVVEKPVKKEDSHLALKADMNIAGTMKMTCDKGHSETTTLDNSPFVGMDYTFNPESNLRFGIGMLYEFNKNNNVMPVYGFLKLPMTKQLLLTGAMGYNFFTLKEPLDYVKVNNGMYYAVGLEGVVNPQLSLFAEYISYTNQMEITACNTTSTLDYLYNKIALGVKINL